MIRINLDMDMPKECHECLFQLKFKDGEVGPWYMRRCVIMHRNIEYPRPEWCPLEEQEPKQIIRKQKKCGNSDGSINHFAEWYCPHCNMLILRGFNDPSIKFCYRCGKPILWGKPVK